MKILLSILVLTSFFAFLLASCSSNDTNQVQASLGQRATLSVGQTGVVKGEGLSFKFIKVSGDSRCATGVQCIQAGDAKCDVQFTYGGSLSEVTLIDVGGTQGFTQTGFKQYNLSFRVDPYPEAGKTIAPLDYKLLITVTK